MIQLTGIGVRNLRALRDTGVVDLKPINILVGKNSAGKSSFARILPLLKQSAERRKQAPLLWFGRLVDFGSFGEALSSFADEREIQMNLRFSTPPAIYPGRRRFESGPNLAAIDVQMTLSAESEESRTVLRRLDLNVFGVRVQVVVEGPREVVLFVDDERIDFGDMRVSLVQGSIVPQLRVHGVTATPSATVSDAAYFSPQSRERMGQKLVRSAVSQFVHGNTAEERKDEIAERLPLASADILLECCRRLAGAPDTWRQSMSSWVSTRHYVFTTLRRALVINKLEVLLTDLDLAAHRFCEGISYLEPLRATAQRYYRREELSTDELDPKGLNTTFFIQGLTQRERASLNSWLQRTFGFTLTVRTVGGHTSLNVETEGMSSGRNMADVGLGYSQLAPVAIQLWAATRRASRKPLSGRVRISGVRSFDDTRSVVVVEQPELHLHPAYQAKLADVFAACVAIEPDSDSDTDSDSGDVLVVAETHSPNLINRLGELVSEGRISMDDVQVLVFEPDPEVEGATSIRIATFDDRGVLKNWPIGFFDY